MLLLGLIPVFAPALARVSPLRLVNLFVDQPLAEILGWVDMLALDVIQLHGDEPPALGQALRRAAEGKDGPPSTPLGAEATSPADHEKPTVMGQVPDLDAFLCDDAESECDRDVLDL